MSSSIRYIDDQDGNHVFPVTHERAVRDSEGVTLETKLGQKQATLISGTNIKTVKGTSILGPGNIDVQDGKSAYQLWLDQGNVGTEAEFIASLKGSQGEKGDTGAQGPQGPKGKDGGTLWPTFEIDAAMHLQMDTHEDTGAERFALDDAGHLVVEL